MAKISNCLKLALILNFRRIRKLHDKMKNVIVYSRVSTDEQAQQGYSLEYQEETIRRYCDHKRYNIVKSYVEDYSAKTFNRPEWKSLIEFLTKNKGKVDSILFLRWDRFSRNLHNSLDEIARLKKLGVNIEAVEAPIDTSTPESLLIQAISLALPQIENDKISIRSKEGSHKARLSGCFTGQAPRGYVNIRNDKDSTLAFSADAPLIKQAFEKMASGMYSADEIRKWLNSNNINVCKNQFLNIVRNITYTGKIYVKPFKDQKETIVDGLHPALISDEIFAAANDVLDGRKRKMKFKDDKSDLYPLKGFLKCQKHCLSLTGGKSKGRYGNYHYYLCTTKHGKCKRYPIDWVHNLIELKLGEIQFAAKILLSYRSVLESVFENENVDRRKNIKQCEETLVKLNNRKKRIQDDYMDGKISSGDYQDLKMNIDNQIFTEERNLNNFSKEISPFREYLQNHVPMLESLVTFYRKSDG